MDSVPVGKDENNKLTETEGKEKISSNPKSHIELSQNKNTGIDFETASKLSGSRFVILKENFALLERALINFMLDIHTRKFGYTEISTTYRKEDIMYGTGQLPKFEDDQFEIKQNDIKNRKLIPTAENEQRI